MPKPSWAETERKANSKRNAEKAKLYAEMVESITIRADGTTYTKLKPGIAEGAEFANDWQRVRFPGY